MKNRNSIIALSAIFTILIIVVAFIFLELQRVKAVLIDKYPDIEVLPNIEHTNNLWIIGFIIMMISIAYSLRIAWKCPKQKIKEAERTADTSTDDIENLKKEEQAREEQAIEDKVAEIMELVKSDDIKQLSEEFLVSLAKQYQVAQGICYALDKKADDYRINATYAYYSNENKVRNFALGHGLPGQVALNQELLNLANVPKQYLTIMSGLGKSNPKNLLLLPIVKDSKTVAVFEIASFSIFEKKDEQILKQLAKIIAPRY